MKPIMSFWSKPYEKNVHNKWLTDKSWNLSWILSVESITRFHGKPHLYTDSAGANLLQNDLGLSFASIDTSLDELKQTNPRFCTLGRTYAISIQDEPFLHYDYDAYLFESIPEDMLQSDILFQKEKPFDIASDGIVRSGNAFHRPDLFNSFEIANLPDSWNKGIVANKIKTYELGVMGGKNLSYFRNYAQIIFDIINTNNEEKWLDIHAKAKRPFIGTAHDVPGFVPRYTLDEYLPYCLAKSKNITPVFLTDQEDTFKMAHIGPQKGRYSDFYGRLLRRIYNDYPERTNKIHETIREKSEIPRVSVIIIPDGKSVSIYDTVLRASIPRKISPDEVLLSDHGLSINDKKLLSKLDGIRIIPGYPSFVDSLRNVFKRTSGQLIVVIDGHIKAPKLYLERLIAAHLTYPNAAFCTASSDFSDKKQAISYGALRTDYGATPDSRLREDPILDMPQITALYGGIYAFPSKALHVLFSGSNIITTINDISDVLIGNNFDLRCIKSILASHNFKQKIEQTADTLIP